MSREEVRGEDPQLQGDEVIRRTVPGVHYAIKWKRAYYGSTKTGWMRAASLTASSLRVCVLVTAAP
jgi:hypothetical protein